jgi:hypothetical protein
MSDPRDERPSDDRQHEDWLTPLAGPDRPVGAARGSLRDRSGSLRGGGSLRQRPAPAPTLDSARVRTPRSIVAPRPPAETPADAEALQAPRAPVKVSATPRAASPLSAARTKLRRPALPGMPALPAVRISAADVRRLASHRPTLHRPTLHRPHWRLSRRQTAALGVGLVALVGSVGSLAMVVPNKPVVDPGTGAVNTVALTAAAAPPTSTFNFGPYFAATEGKLLMMGSDGQTTFVWGSTDGSHWERYTSDDAFGPADRRFVALGFAADGNGGYVAVGDSFDAAGNVSASAWYSRDGKKWFAASVDFPQNAEMMGLAVGSEAMVSAGNGVSWISRGGSSWKMVALPGATGYVPRAVRTWAGGYAIVSAWAGEGDRQSAVWVSPDGETWLQAWSALTLFDVEDAIPYGGGLVAVGSQGRTVDELATPTPKPTPTPSTSTKPKVTPKATKTPTQTAETSGSPGASSAPTPSPLPTTAEIAYQIGGSWSSANGLQWFRGNNLGGPYVQSMTSVTQVFDSLVAVGSAPADVRGPIAAPNGNLTLWITDDGNAWKPILTDEPALSRGRVIQYGSHMVVAGVAPGGALSVLTGAVSLGTPLPPVLSSPTPAIAISLRALASPMLEEGKDTDVLGPLVGAAGHFYAFITQAAGTGVWTSTDGRAWTQQAEPADLLPEGTKDSTPVVLDAVEDGRGGILAVGKITTSDGDTAAIWRLSGGTWTRAKITGSAPTVLGSVVEHDGKFVAAADVPEGPRLMVSEDGTAWVEASLAGSSGYLLDITSWAGGFIASGEGAGSADAEDESDASPSATPAPYRIWTSPDGLAWTAATDWDLPRNPGPVVGAGEGLVITSTGVTGKDSWWWSADGKSWQEAQLTTVQGGCLTDIAAGLVKVAPPAAEAEDPAWAVWVSEDGRSWQNPGIDDVTFGVGSVCRVAAVGSKIVILGWESAGAVKVYYSK